MSNRLPRSQPADAVSEPHKAPEAGTNYVADREQCPEWVCFENGRTVFIRHENGKTFLEVGWAQHRERWLRRMAAAEDDAGSVNIGSAEDVLKYMGIKGPSSERAEFAKLNRSQWPNNEGLGAAPIADCACGLKVWLKDGHWLDSDGNRGDDQHQHSPKVTGLPSWVQELRLKAEGLPPLDVARGARCSWATWQRIQREERERQYRALSETVLKLIDLLELAMKEKA